MKKGHSGNQEMHCAVCSCPASAAELACACAELVCANAPMLLGGGDSGE